MEGQVDTTRLAVIRNIETILSRAFPRELKGERISIREEITRWSEEFAGERNVEIDISEQTEPVARTTVIVSGRRPYIIAVHDPMGLPRRLPAESITGADYAVEFPINSMQDKLLFVQLKRESYGMPPKQYFGVGAAYMFMQYLGLEWLWFDRFRTGAEYVTKRRRPHNEFFFVKIIENDVYIPLSSILRTFNSKRYKLSVNLASNPPKSGDAEYEQTAKYVEFSDMRQHLSEYYVSLTEFMNAANNCSIGVVHTSDPTQISRKVDVFFSLSQLLSRPNVVVIETTSTILRELRRLL